jgi:two-component system sensor histidine kinase/response regulator
LADEVSVKQILDNLMSNAIKFSPPGSEVTVEMSTGDHFLKILVDDQGPGFTENDLKHLFEDYRRLSARPTGDEPSTGLGLAIAKRRADRMGAPLTVGNRPNASGSRAELRLPLAE